MVVSVPDEIGAYRMFETLNDRGLRASQADILKNHFFSKAGTRLQEAQARWRSISSAIETSGDEDENELLVNYLGHLWITKHGPTKEKDLAASIKSKIANASSTMQFLTEADNAVDAYLALSSPTSDVFKGAAKQYVYTISHHLKVDKIRPLLFAIVRHFTQAEQEKAFRLCLKLVRSLLNRRRARWQLVRAVFASRRGNRKRPHKDGPPATRRNERICSDERGLRTSICQQPACPDLI